MSGLRVRVFAQDHVEECEFEDVKCPDPNCNIVMARSRLENHQKNECQWRVVVCDYCEDKYAVCKEEVRVVVQGRSQGGKGGSILPKLMRNLGRGRNFVML